MTQPELLDPPAADPSGAVSERIVVRAVLAVALGGLLLGGLAWATGREALVDPLWGGGAALVALRLLVSIVRSLMAGRMGVDAIALVSMTAALALGETLAAVVVAVMYAGGTVLEDYAVARAERDLRGLVDRAPRIAHLVSSGGVRDVPVAELSPGDMVQVNAGEVVPVDGTLADAHALIDGSAMTGEPIPVAHEVGAPVLSGTVNAGATFTLRATARATDSAYAGVIRMVSAAHTAKAPFIRAADRLALLLLPLTLAVAGLAWLWSSDAVRGLAVLVVATPCPLILAAPVAFVGGVSRAARRGILVKGGAALEALARVGTVVFDKTGTLTVGGARVVGIETAPGVAPDRVLGLAAALDQSSHHVVAEAIVAAARQAGLVPEMARDVTEVQGEGIAGHVADRAVRVGSQGFALAGDAAPDWVARAVRRAGMRSALTVFVSEDGVGLGAVLLGDEIRRDAPRAIRALRALGVGRIVMLTGDRADAAQSVGAALALDHVLAERSVAEKVDAVGAEQRQAPTIMVGDGINDAPALAAAGVGIAMGARGASAASQAADVVLLVDRVDRVADAVDIARRTRRIAMQSMVVGLALSGLAMVAAALGWLSPVEGALTQEAIDVAVILNALRSLLSGHRRTGRILPPQALADLKAAHRRIEPSLARLSGIADTLDTAAPDAAAGLIAKARDILGDAVIPHEDADEAGVFPDLRALLPDGHGLAAMSRAHREIGHLYRQLDAMSKMATSGTADPLLVRDAQRVIETLVTLIRIHNAQEEDIYDYAAAI